MIAFLICVWMFGLGWLAGVVSLVLYMTAEVKPRRRGHK
jgi:ABC-type phosphate/phosphonate transport system permease subunit